jgi:hypothetical protein
VDQFLAHITTIEAALGMRADYQKSFRVAPDRHKGMRATNRMRGRVAGLLGDQRNADQYERLFDVRSAFLHGRAITPYRRRNETRRAKGILARTRYPWPGINQPKGG